MRRYRELPPPEDLPEVFHEWLLWLENREGKDPHTTVAAYSQGLRRILSVAEIPPQMLSPLFPALASDLEHERTLVSRQWRLTDLVGDLVSGKVDADGNRVRERVRGETQRLEPEFSKSTVNQTLAALKSFYRYCVSDRLIPETPDLEHIRDKLLLEDPYVDPEYLRPAEIQDLYKVAASEDLEHGRRVRWPARDLAMCGFLSVLGLRAAELESADVNWITHERLRDSPRDGSMRGSQWMLEVTGKRNRIRRLPLSPELVRAYEVWLAERSSRFGEPRPADPLFVTNAGKRFNYRQLLYWLHLLLSVAGLRQRSLHSLRHTAGVQLAADGVPANVIQYLLGHTNINTTGIYIELAGIQLTPVLQETEANELLAGFLEDL